MTTPPYHDLTDAGERILNSVQVELPEFSAHKVLDVISKHVGEFELLDPTEKDPSVFALHLLLLYKIGSCICECQQGSAPSCIWHCFSGYDAERIFNHCPSLGHRLFLCAPSNLDIKKNEWELAGEVFFELTGSQLEDFPEAEPAEQLLVQCAADDPSQIAARG